VVCRSYGADSTAVLIDLNFIFKIHPLINNDNWRATKFPFAPAAQPQRGGIFLAVNVSIRPSPSGATHQQSLVVFSNDNPFQSPVKNGGNGIE